MPEIEEAALSPPPIPIREERNQSGKGNLATGELERGSQRQDAFGNLNSERPEGFYLAILSFLLLDTLSCLNSHPDLAKGSRL